MGKSSRESCGLGARRKDQPSNTDELERIPHRFLCCCAHRWMETVLESLDNNDSSFFLRLPPKVDVRPHCVEISRVHRVPFRSLSRRVPGTGLQFVCDVNWSIHVAGMWRHKIAAWPPSTAEAELGRNTSTMKKFFLCSISCSVTTFRHSFSVLDNQLGKFSCNSFHTSPETSSSCYLPFTVSSGGLFSS